MFSNKYIANRVEVRLDKIRKNLLEDLYDDCKNSTVTEDVLLQQFQKLKREGKIDNNCTFENLVKMCELKSDFFPEKMEILENCDQDLDFDMKELERINNLLKIPDGEIISKRKDILGNLLYLKCKSRPDLMENYEQIISNRVKQIEETLDFKTVDNICKMRNKTGYSNLWKPDMLNQVEQHIKDRQLLIDSHNNFQDIYKEKEEKEEEIEKEEKDEAFSFSKQFRGAGVILYSNDKFLLAKSPSGIYSFPKGHVSKADQDYKDTALRELREETGYILKKKDLDKNIKSRQDKNIYFLVNLDRTEHKIGKKFQDYYTSSTPDKILSLTNFEISEITWMSIDEIIDKKNDSDEMFNNGIINFINKYENIKL